MQCRHREHLQSPSGGFSAVGWLTAGPDSVPEVGGRQGELGSTGTPNHRRPAQMMQQLGFCSALLQEQRGRVCSSQGCDVKADKGCQSAA